jgi:hypothetical protein
MIIDSRITNVHENQFSCSVFCIGHCPGLTTAIVMPQLHASAALLSRCEDRSQLSTIANPNSRKHDIASASPPSHKSKPPTAHKESLCLVIDLIMSEDSHSHAPTGELCGAV